MIAQWKADLQLVKTGAVVVGIAFAAVTRKEAEVAQKVLNYVDPPHPGVLYGVIPIGPGGFSEAEAAIAEALEAEGNEVEALEVVQGQKNPDALVNGVKTEFKTVTVAGPNTLKNQIQDGLRQGVNVVVDVRGTSITKAEALQQIQRVEGNVGSVQGKVTILTQEGTLKH